MSVNHGSDIRSSLAFPAQESLDETNPLASNDDDTEVDSLRPRGAFIPRMGAPQLPFVPPSAFIPDDENPSVYLTDDDAGDPHAHNPAGLPTTTHPQAGYTPKPSSLPSPQSLDSPSRPSPREDPTGSSSDNHSPDLAENTDSAMDPLAAFKELCNSGTISTAAGSAYQGVMSALNQGLTTLPQLVESMISPVGGFLSSIGSPFTSILSLMSSVPSSVPDMESFPTVSSDPILIPGWHGPASTAYHSSQYRKEYVQDCINELGVSFDRHLYDAVSVSVEAKNQIKSLETQCHNALMSIADTTPDPRIARDLMKNTLHQYLKKTYYTLYDAQLRQEDIAHAIKGIGDDMEKVMDEMPPIPKSGLSAYSGSTNAGYSNRTLFGSTPGNPDNIASNPLRRWIFHPETREPVEETNPLTGEVTNPSDNHLELQAAHFPSHDPAPSENISHQNIIDNLPRTMPRVLKDVIARGLSRVGTPYSWGGGGVNGPTLGVHDYGVADSYGDYAHAGEDCSGLMEDAFAAAGIDIGKYSGAQYDNGMKIPISFARPGDRIYYGPGGSEHTALLLGNGLMLEAPQSGQTVHVTPVRVEGAEPYVVRSVPW